MRRATGFILAGVLLGGGVIAQQRKQQDIDLQAAIRTETVNGDLNSAIKQYGEIAMKYKNDRPVAAMALVRMAEAYQKMGDAESRRIYERVVREYSDQREAVAIAMAKLGPGAGEKGKGMASRQVWTLPDNTDVFGTVSPDGNLVPYVNWAQKGDLFLHDLTTGDERRITKTASAHGGSSGDYAEESCFSRDGKWLAYSWFKGKEKRYEIRLIDSRGSGEPRRVFDDEEVGWISPADWSPDGKFLAVQLSRKDRSAQIGVVRVEDGSLRILKTVDWRGPNRLLFSADGKYLAYDLPEGDTAVNRDVFILAVDGGSETRVVAGPANDVVAGWSPEGKHLLFASDRGGSMGLWSIPIVEGKVSGQPDLLKADTGQGALLGLTKMGRLYTQSSNQSGPDVRIARFDFQKGKFRSTPVSLVQTYVGNITGGADWSPDGKYIAYGSLRTKPGTRNIAIVIHNPQTGTLRELSPSPGFTSLQGMAWARDGRSLVVSGSDFKGRNGIFGIDLESGQGKLLLARPPTDGPRFPTLSPDGSKLYFRGIAEQRTGFAIYEWEPATGALRELFRRPDLGVGIVSPDGKHIAVSTVAFGPETKPTSVFVLPSDGGEAKELARAEHPESVINVGWAPDSRSIVIAKGVGTGGFRAGMPFKEPPEFQMTSLDGNSRKLDLGPGGQFGPFLAQPDGDLIVFAVGQPRKPGEVWVLENFLAASPTGK